MHIHTTTAVAAAMIAACAMRCDAAYTWCKARLRNGHKCTKVASTFGDGYCEDHFYEKQEQARVKRKQELAQPIALPQGQAIGLPNGQANAAILAASGNWQGARLRKSRELRFVQPPFDDQINEQARQAEAARIVRARQEAEQQEAEMKLRLAEQEKWSATQERIHAERQTRENERRNAQWLRDSEAELARQREMQAERERQEAERRAQMLR